MLDRDLDLDVYEEEPKRLDVYYECQDALEDLVRELYNPKLNVSAIKNNLEFLCDSFNLHFDVDKPLNICTSKEVEHNKMFQYMVGYTRAYAEKFNKR